MASLITLSMTDDETAALQTEYQRYLAQPFADTTKTFQLFVQEMVSHGIFQAVASRQRHYLQAQRIERLVQRRLTTQDFIAIDAILDKSA